MKRSRWHHGAVPSRQLRDLLEIASEPGYVVVAFDEGGDGAALAWSDLEAWTRSRAVTVADIGGAVASPALDVAMCSDLVYLRDGATLRLSTGCVPPSPGVLWAMARRGRMAVARGVLDAGDLGASEALALGLAEAVVDPENELPLPAGVSIAALTAARDLIRSSATGSAGLALELATFRLLFAAGDPAEGARAFLEKRDPDFDR